MVSSDIVQTLCATQLLVRAVSRKRVGLRLFDAHATESTHLFTLTLLWIQFT
jgi:hypothetical protein